MTGCSSWRHQTESSTEITFILTFFHPNRNPKFFPKKITIFTCMNNGAYDLDNFFFFSTVATYIVWNWTSYYSSLIKFICNVSFYKSDLGPLLFLLYINDISNVIPELKVKLFADDTNIFLFNKSIESLFVDASKALDKLNNWFSANKLSLNVDKTHYCIFRKRGNILDKNIQYPSLTLDNHINWTSELYKISRNHYRWIYYIPGTHQPPS